jgi:hypothetical protein
MLIAVLNGDGGWRRRREERATLRRWVEAWMGHDRNLQHVPRVVTEVNGSLSRYHRRLAPCGSEEVNMPEPFDFCMPEDGHQDRHLVTFDWPERTGNRPYMVSFLARGDDTPAVAHWFAEFLSGSHADDLRPCGRQRCEKYFLRAGKRRKYCSLACARHDTAVRATEKRRRRLTEERLKTARRVCARFSKSWPLDWRERIAERVGVKRHWVSRQVKLRNLPSPPGRRSGG